SVVPRVLLAPRAALLEKRDSGDDLLVQDPHQATRLFVQGPHQAARLFVAASDFASQPILAGANHRGHLLADGRKFTAHLATKLQNLLLEGFDTSRQAGEGFHSLLQNFDSTGDGPFRHWAHSIPPNANAVPRRTTTVASSP